MQNGDDGQAWQQAALLGLPPSYIMLALTSETDEDQRWDTYTAICDLCGAERESDDESGSVEAEAAVSSEAQQRFLNELEALRHMNVPDLYVRLEEARDAHFERSQSIVPLSGEGAEAIEQLREEGSAKSLMEKLRTRRAAAQKEQ